MTKKEKDWFDALVNGLKSIQYENGGTTWFWLGLDINSYSAEGLGNYRVWSYSICMRGEDLPYEIAYCCYDNHYEVYDPEESARQMWPEVWNYIKTKVEA